MVWLHIICGCLIILSVFKWTKIRASQFAMLSTVFSVIILKFYFFKVFIHVPFILEIGFSNSRLKKETGVSPSSLQMKKMCPSPLQVKHRDTQIHIKT